MTRPIAVLMVAALAVAACGSSDDPATGAGATTTSAPAPDQSTTISPVTTTTVGSTTTVAPTATMPTTVGITTAETYDVEVDRDVVWGTGMVRDGTVDLVAHVWVPVDAPGPRPVYIHYPGGGFFEADPDNSGPAEALARRGFVTASIGYRVQGDDPIPTDRVGGVFDVVGGTEGNALARAIAAAVEDGVAGAEWLLGRADELDLDTDRVVLGGGSAGAITANHIVYTADDFGFDRPAVAATVDLWGGFTLATPADAVAGGEPPVFIVHGTADPVVSYSFTEDFVAAADAVGLPYELHPVEGAGHGVDLVTATGDDGEPLLDHLVTWLQTTLYRE